MSCGPPCSPCAPPPPTPCPQTCSPPPPSLQPCRHKPVMRGLHWAQTERHIGIAFVLAAIGGAAYYGLVKRPRELAYKEYHELSEFDDWADEMGKRGLFQSVPPSFYKADKE